MSPRSAAQARCTLCDAKEVSEPRGEEKYCRDCWEKKIAIEDIVAREFALKRYIRAHSAEKYLVYHSTLKRPCGQLIVIDDGYDLFLSLVLYPSFAWDEPAYHLEGDPGGPIVLRATRRRHRGGGHRAVGRWQVASRNLQVREPGTGGLEWRDVAGRRPAELAVELWPRTDL